MTEEQKPIRVRITVTDGDTANAKITDAETGRDLRVSRVEIDPLTINSQLTAKLTMVIDEIDVVATVAGE